MTYDIATIEQAGERRLAKIAAVCERYGDRVQYSVFACRVSEVSFLRLLHELADVLDPTVDRVDVYRIQGSIAESRTSLGRAVRRELGSPWIL
ncbi:MAG: CRISPR-associated endonuclease Cas2 [Acidimicrobiales bacterium]